jgi:hypothetical protein
VTQEGAEVVLRFPFPSRTTTGDPLTSLTSVTVLREITPAPPGMQPPPPPEGEAREREERVFLSRAEVLADLPRAQLDAHTAGRDLVVRDSLVPLYGEKRLGRVFLRYGVTATRDGRRRGELSPLISLFPRVPPDRPLALAAAVEEGRVCLEWRPPAGMLDGSTPARVSGYVVYRRDLAEEAYTAPLATDLAFPVYVDESVRAGSGYVYTVRAAPAGTGSSVLGPPAAEVPVDTRDVFPPAEPQGLLVLAERDGNRLVWNPVLTPDLAGYIIHRAVAGTWQRLAVITDSTYVDRGAPAGSTYRVSSVDRAGNESARAAPAEEAR